ncbi:MAG: glycosyltransferase [Verrucomicrobiota bacterium JB022]|nr:glycosyltransferase [Verrucomicrobiota bacterium JB022]
MHHASTTTSFYSARILLLVGLADTLHPQRLAARLAFAEELQAQGHQVTLLVRANRRLNLSPSLPLVLHTYGSPFTAGRRAAEFTAEEVTAGRQALRRLTEEKTFDLVHVFGVHAASSIVRPELAQSALPWVVHVEDDELRSCLGRRVFHEPFVDTLNSAFGITTSSQLGQSLVRDWAHRSSTVLPTATEPCRQQLVNLSKSVVPMMFIRILGNERGQLERALRLVASLQRESAVLAQIYAPGFAVGEVERLAVTLGARLRVHSRLSERLEETLLRYSALYLQINDGEDAQQIESNLLQALRFRAAVITTRSPLASGLVRHMETGLVLDEHNEQAWLMSARFMLEFPERRRSLAERGGQFAKWYLDAHRIAHEATAAYAFYIDWAQRHLVA